MPNIKHHNVRWSVWIGVFSSLQSVIKKDRDDAEGVLYSLYPEFNKQIKSANFEIIVKISSAITLNNKKSNGVFCSKVSAIYCFSTKTKFLFLLKKSKYENCVTLYEIDCNFAPRNSCVQCTKYLLK